MKMALVFLMLFQCHQESGAQFNIVTVLLTIIFQHNFKKLLISLDFFLFSQGYKNYCKIVKEAKKNFLSYFELCGRGTETF